MGSAWSKVLALYEKPLEVEQPKSPEELDVDELPAQEETHEDKPKRTRQKKQA